MFLRVDYWNQRTDLYEKCECYYLLIVTVIMDVACCKHRVMLHLKIAKTIWQHSVLSVSTRRRICCNSKMELVTYSCCWL